MKNILVAAKHTESPFNGKRVLKGQAFELPKSAMGETDDQRKKRIDETQRVIDRMIEDGRAEYSDTALGPYNPGEPGSPGMTEGIHYNIPEESIQHDGSIESAERLAQLRKNKRERDKVAARKAQSGETKEPTQEEIDAAKAAELAKDGPKDERILEGGEAAKEILKGAESGANADAAGASTDKPAEEAAPADDKSAGKKGKK